MAVGRAGRGSGDVHNVEERNVDSMEGAVRAVNVDVASWLRAVLYGAEEKSRLRGRGRGCMLLLSCILGAAKAVLARRRERSAVGYIMKDTCQKRDGEFGAVILEVGIVSIEVG